MARGWAGERPRHPTSAGWEWVGPGSSLVSSQTKSYTLGRKTLFLFVFINFTCVTYRQ